MLKFIDISEVFYYMNTIVKTDYEVDDWVIPVTREQLFDRLKGMFYIDIWDDSYEEPLRKYIENLSDTDVTKIFYKNNFVVFTDLHTEVKDIYDQIFASVKNYQYAKTEDDVPEELREQFKDNEYGMVKGYNYFVNNQYFMDPNSPPETITDLLEKLKNIIMKYVYHPFLTIDRIFRLKYFMRGTVVIVDTDSNIMTLDRWVEYSENNLLRSTYGRDDEHNIFIIINTMAYLISAVVADTLDMYGRYSNIPEDFRPKLNMKNEFYFSRLIIGVKKKRYLSAIKLREGNLLDPYKADVKGFDFMKATTSAEAKKRFDSIVKKHILESPLPDVHSILTELYAFEQDIRDSIHKGELKYLPLGNAKDLEAYARPYSQQGVRGALAWNYIYPDRAISFPSKVSILKLKIFRPEDITDMQTSNPKLYNVIMDKIFGNIEEIASKGLQVLAIPLNESIPDWCFPYIDYNTVINNILGQFQGVLDIFGISSPEVGKSISGVNRKTKKFSNMVRL